MKILSEGADLFNVDGQKVKQLDRKTDRHDEANSRSLQSCERT